MAAAPDLNSANPGSDDEFDSRARASSGSRWNSIPRSDSSSSSDEEEGNDDEITGQRLPVPSHSLPAKARKAQSLDTGIHGTRTTDATATTENGADPVAMAKNLPQNRRESLLNTSSREEWIEGADYSVLGGEDFRFGMVLVHDSRDFASGKDDAASDKNDDSGKRLSFQGLEDSAARASGGAVDGNGNPLFDFSVYDASDSMTSSALEIAGDTFIRFKDKSQNLFHFWFHTNFISENNKLVLTKKQLDCKAIKKNKAYVDDFAVELTFAEVSTHGEECDGATGATSSDGENSSDRISGAATRSRSISQFAFRESGGHNSSS